MSDSSMYTSLFALVDSYLASLQESSENMNTTSLCIPPLHRNNSDSLILTRPRLPIPTLGAKESSIQTILVKQIANMFRAKEKKEKEYQKKLEEDMKQLNFEEGNNSNIDLMKAINQDKTYDRKFYSNEQETLSSSSSMESLFELKFTCNSELEERNVTGPMLPCTTDMSYILKEKVKMGKCSVFGKVLTSRLRPVAAPYLREEVPTHIVRFDFSTPSPCDIVKGNLRKPTKSCNFALDITKFV